MTSKSNSIGDRLRAVRVQLGYTQEEFSKALLGKENKATISAYENNRLDIAEKAKVILFTTYGVNKDWLESGEGVMFTTTSDKVHELAKDLPRPNKFVRLLNLDEYMRVERTDKEIENLAKLIKKLADEDNANND